MDFALNIINYNNILAKIAKKKQNIPFLAQKTIKLTKITLKTTKILLKILKNDKF